MPGKVWDEITYPFLNFNGSTIEVKEWISNCISHYNRCNYLSMLGLKLNHISKRGQLYVFFCTAAFWVIQSTKHCFNNNAYNTAGCQMTNGYFEWEHCISSSFTTIILQWRWSCPCITLRYTRFPYNVRALTGAFHRFDSCHCKPMDCVAGKSSRVPAAKSTTYWMPHPNSVAYQGQVSISDLAHR